MASGRHDGAERKDYFQGVKLAGGCERSSAPSVAARLGEVARRDFAA
ncbi:MAG TPA: hypothetical protein PLN33_09790 [Hyphomonadaceae bacterium]|jgi:hypothetical protein|nr:hypothetical protein [Hyphomonadaceae bacterium]HPN04817.1 hypothetical protein [Hyphomonadaceae bacterium]